MGRCKDYVGVACVDGSCPKANAEEYAERCMDVIVMTDFIIKAVKIALYLALNIVIKVTLNNLVQLPLKSPVQ